MILLADKIKGDNFSLIEATDVGKAEEFAEIVRNNRQEFKFLPHTSQITTVAKAVAEISGYAAKRQSGEMFFYFVVDDRNKILGCAGVKVKDEHTAEGCYWLDKAYCGNGYATRAINLLEKAVFAAGFQRFEIWCNADNLPSVKIPQRLGYRREGVLRDAEYLDGGYHNVVIFSKLRTDK